MVQPHQQDTAGQGRERRLMESQCRSSLHALHAHAVPSHRDESPQERVLTLDHRHHGRGTVLYAWHPSSALLATVGTLTSLISGTNNAAPAAGAPAAAASAHATTASGHHAAAAAHAKCIWIWSMGGAKAREASGQAIEAARAAAAAGVSAVAGTAAQAAHSSVPPAAAAIPVASSSFSSPSAAAPSSAASAAALVAALQGVSPADVPPNEAAHKLFQIFTPNPAPVIGLEWDAAGNTLAILQAAPAHEVRHATHAKVLLWHLGSQQLEHLDLSLREPTFLRWSRSGSHFAVGTGRGELLLYDRCTRQAWVAGARHKKRITCGAWNAAGQFAFASDDRQISICGTDGKTFGQVKVKSRPTNVKFGGGCGGMALGSNSRDAIVSVSMERKTILLYNLEDPENALELAFQQRYGQIVSFKWFRDGYVMVGFSLGFLVVISTHLDEIGREQFCARFHPQGGLRDLAYDAAHHRVATAAGPGGGGGGGSSTGTSTGKEGAAGGGEAVIKVVDMRDWSEVLSEEIEPAHAAPSSAGPARSGSAAASASSHSVSVGALDKLQWTADGRYLSVSTRNGCLYVYAVASDLSGGGASGARRGASSLAGVKAGDAACMRAARRRAMEEHRSIAARILYKPLASLSMALCAGAVATAGMLALSRAAGISLLDMVRLSMHTYSV